MTITTRVEGIAIQATLTDDGWHAVIMPEIPVMERPFDLRSTYCCPDVATALAAATYDVLTWRGWSGHGFDSTMGDFVTYLTENGAW